MSVNKDTFDPCRDPNYDFQSAGKPETGWAKSDELPDTLVPTHCAFCGVQCGMYLRVANGEVTGVEPRDYPHNRGALCPKGVVAYQQVNHPDRLRYPMIRRGGKGGKLERASWDEALGYIVERWQALQQEHGKNSVAIYSGSSMTNEKCYLMGKFARVGLGTRHVDYNGRLCMSSAGVAYAKAFGMDRAPFPMPDIQETDCILVAGSNVAECFPVMMQWLWRARDHGGKLIVMDPRETATARTADIWLALRPGTDVAILNAMLRHVIVNGMVDEEYVATRTRDWDKVKSIIDSYTPEFAERIAGVPARRVIEAAEVFGRAPRSIIMHARGIEHSTHGVDNCLACINVSLARGQVGKRGAGVMMITGQGNGQGGREVGQKANQLPGYRHIDVLEERQEVAEAWGIPESEIPGEGAAATEMVKLMATGEIKSCLVICSNLMVSLPEIGVVAQALDRLDPLIVIDFFMSETAERADVVLPGSVWCEDEGTTTNLEGRVIKINRAAEPPGEARRDWDIVCELARRLGRGQYFDFKSSREIFDEMCRVSKGGVADYSGITWEKIDRQSGVFWPCKSEDDPGTPRLFTERFAHKDGLARFHPIEYKPAAEEPSDAFPLRLTTGRVVYHYLSGNQTRRLGFLNAQAPEPWVEIHPQTAARFGIAHEDRVRVRTPRGHMELKAVVAPTIRPDTIFIPFHYGHEGAANQLTNPAVEPSVKIPEYKACAATLERIGSPLPEVPQQAKENLTPENAPRMFPYTIGETKGQPEKLGKEF